MRAILSPLVLTVGLALALPAGAQNLLIHGGPIYTGAAKVEAVAVKDGRILAVGSSEDLQKHRGDQTQMMDLKGRAMLPGFAHSPDTATLHGEVRSVFAAREGSTLSVPNS